MVCALVSLLFSQCRKKNSSKEGSKLWSKQTLLDQEIVAVQRLKQASNTNILGKGQTTQEGKPPTRYILIEGTTTLTGKSYPFPLLHSYTRTHSQFHLFTWPNSLPFIHNHVENPTLPPMKALIGNGQGIETCDNPLLLRGCKNCWPFHLKCHPKIHIVAVLEIEDSGSATRRYHMKNTKLENRHYTQKTTVFGIQATSIQMERAIDRKNLVSNWRDEARSGVYRLDFSLPIPDIFSSLK